MHTQNLEVMKRIFFALFVVLSMATMAQNKEPLVKNVAFDRGEELKFRFFYDSWFADITAGYGTLTVTEDKAIKYGRTTYHVVAEGKSKGLFNMFMKVHDRFESWFDEQDFRPYHFVRRTREGGYRKDDDVLFNYTSNQAKSRTASKRITNQTHCIISAFYYARNIDLEGVAVGDIIEVPFFFDDSVYNSAIQFLGTAEIKTDFGRFRCLKIKPMMATGKVFKDPYPMVLYITDDKNRIPVMAESALIVGKVKMELCGYKGLVNEVESLLSP
jgi:hypothetical protein